MLSIFLELQIIFMILSVSLTLILFAGERILFGTAFETRIPEFDNSW